MNKFDTFIRLAKSNIAWSWKQNLLNTLEKANPNLWAESEGNPAYFLEKAQALDSMKSVFEDAKIAQEIDLAIQDLEALEAYKNPHALAYFCMEYGLTTSLRLYSGGLGVLAGDHLKTASDLDWPLCAVGLAYQKGYFAQRLDADGQQFSEIKNNDFSKIPLTPVVKDGKPLKVFIDFPNRKVWAQAWRVGVAKVSLYLLDTNLEENSPEDRILTDQLYSGDGQHRLHQEILLGIGGFELLKSLGHTPKIYHMNEGHAAFLIWARLRELICVQNKSFDQALEYIAQTTVFTTHTPVPAGHDMFGKDQIDPFIDLYTSQMKINAEQLMKLGQRSKHIIEYNCYSMTDLALSGSDHVNGVSEVHARVSREMFHELFPQHELKDVPVKAVTNGVHEGTWVAEEWAVGSSDLESLKNISAKEIWNTKVVLKQRLISQMREHVRKTYPLRGESDLSLAKALEHIREDAFVIGFARRFATYKRATLLFHDLERLEKIISQVDRPVVVFFSGKAHPKDLGGQDLIKQVIAYSRRPALLGKVIFIENYEMDIARLLVQGADVWLNTPTRPLEASGTSGMKAAMNGTLNLSVDDGWWSEAYNGRNGWLVADRKLNEDVEFQLKHDSKQILDLLEQDVLPAYFERDAQGIPQKWVELMRESMLSTRWNFSTRRMLEDYKSYFFNKVL